MTVSPTQRARGQRAYRALRWLQIVGAASLCVYQTWELSRGRHVGDTGLAALAGLTIVGIAAEVIRRRSGLAFTWSGDAK